MVNEVNLNTEIETADNFGVYELSYIYLPSIAPEVVVTKVSTLKDVITKAGGSLISDENPVLIDLAYPMVKVTGTNRHKVQSGYFGWVKFEIPKIGLVEIKKSLDLNDEIVRYLIIKTVKENTLLNGKMKLSKEEKFKRDDKADEEVALNVDAEIAPDKETLPEELDKSIDDLVIA